MAADLQTIAQLLEASLDPSKNKQAESALLQEEKKPRFSLVLLQIVAAESNPYNTRLASALCFKNFVKRNWTDEDGNYKLPEDEVAAIKHELVGLMISVPAKIQTQLGDAISVIADSDFWERWDTLVDDLVSRLTSNNAVANNGVLQVAHSIFKRWRPLFRSDALFTEINHVLSKFARPFLTLCQDTDQAIDQAGNNREALNQLFTTLSLTTRLFYDLSCQDLPPLFEDNISAIASLWHKYLTYDSPSLHTDDENEAGPLEFVKAGVFEVLVLFVQKYEDAFGSLLTEFITSSWNLLTTIGSEAKYDILVSKALQFLTAVARVREHAENFNNEETLSQVVEKVILPNLSLREADIEVFEDEPIEYIRRDLEGSDSDTRRRAATDFLRQLMEQFEEPVTKVVSRYINHYLSDYQKDSKNNWKSKDTAVYLFSSIAAKGAVTSSQGVKSTNSLVDVVDFFQKHIAQDLMDEKAVEPILKVDAIKYLYTFRSLMSREQWHSAFPTLVRHLASSEYVVYTYAAITVERVLALSVEPKQPMFTKAETTPLAKELLEHLFSLIEKESGAAKVQENEFLMRCVMRVLIVIGDGVVPITGTVLGHLIKITQLIRVNPSNPRFYYYHFEALGALIKFAAPTQAENMENALYVPFVECLENDVQEFMPYIFQLFAALLEAQPSNTLSDYYKKLIPPLLTPALWESRGNVPALVRFLSSMITRGGDYIASNNQIEPILGIFQNLISKKANESYSFDLIETVVSSFSLSTLRSYFVTILTLMLSRLQNSRTDNFALRFVRFYHFLAARQEQGLGADFVVNLAESIQSDVFAPLYTSVILPETQKLVRPLDRKVAVIGFTKTLIGSAAFRDRYKKGWGFTCEALLKLLENPPLPVTSAEDAIAEQDVDDLGFGVGFTQLSTCRPVPKDAWPEVADVKVWVGNTLKEANAHGGMIATFMQERLQSLEAKQVAAAYLT